MSALGRPPEGSARVPLDGAREAEAAPFSPDTDLSTYTDPDAMRALFQSALPGFAEGRLQIDQLAVDGVRRNTSVQRNPRRMTLSYRLAVRDQARGLAGSQRLYAEVFRGAESTAAAAELDAATLVPPAFGDPVVHLPGWQMLVWALPNDPGLPQLAQLLDPARMAARLPVRAAQRVQVELLRHEPCHRATLCYRCEDADGQPRTVFAKTFRDRRAVVIDERFTWFWQQALRDGSAPLVAEPLGWDAATRTVWQAPATGVPLREVLRGPGAGAALSRVAEALARLHAAPLVHTLTAAPRSTAHWLAEVQRRSRKIARIDDRLAARALHIASRIEAHTAHAAQRPLSLIHGDCHPDQVWVQGSRVVLFDFDEFTLGDPMEDLAEFVLKLEQLGTDPAQVAAFVADCAAADAPQHDPASLAWHMAVQSLLQASRAFVYQQPGWAELLEQRLAACEARVTVLGGGL